MDHRAHFTVIERFVLLRQEQENRFVREAATRLVDTRLLA